NGNGEQVGPKSGSPFAVSQTAKLGVRRNHTRVRIASLGLSVVSEAGQSNRSQQKRKIGETARTHRRLVGCCFHWFVPFGLLFVAWYPAGSRNPRIDGPERIRAPGVDRPGGLWN